MSMNYEPALHDRLVAPKGADPTLARAGELRARGPSPAVPPVAPAHGVALHGRRLLPPARFAFEARGTPDVAWRVLRGELRESLSELYECTLDILTDDESADAAPLLGSAAVFVFTRDDRIARRAGIVRRLERLGTQDGQLRCRVTLVPAAWALTTGQNSRIFQQRTVPEILREVLAQPLMRARRSLRTALGRSYPAREYCVQYQESDWAFAARLMADEGITFCFEHPRDARGAEVLVLADANGALAATASATERDEPLALVGPGEHPDGDESVTRFESVDALAPSRVALREFDWTRPGLVRAPIAEQVGPAGPALGEVYEYQPGLTWTGYDDEQPHAYRGDDGAERAELSRQRIAAGRRVGRGQSNALGLTPGATFALAGHQHAAADPRYLVTAVTHSLSAPDELAADARELATATTLAGGAAADARYTNRFECVPASVPFRPSRALARPRIHGAQTATVVGPAGQEVYTDHHGRIKVRFHWDRAAGPGEARSCWVRVQQAWAGAGFGTWFVPRIGMEVVVTFLEGDPDRPLVTGCVYNGTHPTPFELPGEMTRSGVRTRSTPDSEGHNELHFEDAAGHEAVYLRAQRDLAEYVRNDHRTTVRRDQTQHVHGEQAEVIGCNQHLTVGGSRTHDVAKNERIGVTGDRSLEVGGLSDTYVKRQRTTVVDGREVAKLHGGRETVVQDFDRLRVRGEQVTHVSSSSTTTIGSSSKTLVGCEEEPGASVLRVEGTVSQSSTQRMELTSETEIVLRCGSSSIRLTRTHVEIRGEEVRLEGRGSHVRLRENNVGVQASDVVRVRGENVRLLTSCGTSLLLDNAASLNATRIQMRPVAQDERGE